MKCPDVCLAWWEKFTIFWLIFLLNSTMIFYMLQDKKFNDSVTITIVNRMGILVRSFLIVYESKVDGKTEYTAKYKS